MRMRMGMMTTTARMTARRNPAPGAGGAGGAAGAGGAKSSRPPSDNPVYTEHWAGQREVTVRIDADQIVIRRPAAASESTDSESDSESDE